ncbi:MAG: Tm-1-like ATP-binding domain-containing protein [Syntrophobacteraceae bacterium]|jgi:uncharacterized protein (UPF0261 family)
MGSTSIRKTILIIGTLDTKGEECLYIKELAQKSGFGAIIIDCGSLGTPVGSGDITRRKVAERAGWSLEQLIETRDKGKIIGAMTEGLVSWTAELFREQKIHGVIAVGGGQGTAFGTAAMQLFPLGFPKVMVSTIASGNMRPFLQTKDIAVFPAITDVFGLNFIFNRILENAVWALLAMVQNYRPIEKSSRKVIAATAFGVTTLGLKRMKRIFNEKGFDMILFHANGMGGRAMEELAEGGYFDAVMDWSTQEIIAHIGHGIFDAGEDRLHSPAAIPIPYIIAPGAIDYITMGPFDTLPEGWDKRKFIIHNRNITLVRATAKEMGRAAEFLAEKANAAVGPLKVMIPLEGFSEPNAVGKPFFDPDADRFFLETLERLMRPGIEIIKLPLHINDERFVRVAVEQMLSMMGM